MQTLFVKSDSQFQCINITSQIQKIVKDSAVKDGLITLFVPHTTAAITINEGADPSVVHDLLYELDKVIPLRDNYQHLEGNSAAHIKSSLVGCSQTVLIENGSLVLGTWQAVFFCEFDGPRNRKVFVKIIGK
ncbi:MAG: YjbQ family protein [Candidatus Cloacimonetes bacterium]|nr:YjbQ family protein [Candidatus Cloacimonadota bacterium]MBL7086658.1 YjbQ family protein [Candidatus Cloacimonadota bacterium]